MTEAAVTDAPIAEDPPEVTAGPANGGPGAEVVALRARLGDYALLLKPRVMSLVVFTALVGLVLAPGTIDPLKGALAVILIAIGAGASGAINMWYDRDIDANMARTKNRPIPSGRMGPTPALVMGTVLSVASVAGMEIWINDTAAFLLALTIVYYVFIYTVWLKRRTPQNIVIGGAAGSFPPMIGWAAVTGSIEFDSAILFAIIFLWTPPHFWALALYRSADYANAGVPMLPVVSGVRETKRQILIYSILLVPITLAPAGVGMSGPVYAAIAAALGAWFLRHAVVVWRDETGEAPRRMFLFSILYLFLIFGSLVADHFIQPLLA